MEFICTFKGITVGGIKSSFPNKIITHFPQKPTVSTGTHLLFTFISFLASARFDKWYLSNNFWWKIVCHHGFDVHKKALVVIVFNIESRILPLSFFNCLYQFFSWPRIIYFLATFQWKVEVNSASCFFLKNVLFCIPF